MASSMKEHLAQFHESEATHHVHKSAHHKTMAGHYRKLASSLSKTEVSEAQTDSKATLEAMAGMHEATSQKHTERAAYHEDCVDKCSKAMDAADLNKLVPTKISTVAPTRPTAVPRYGQRPIGEATAVEPDIRKMLALDADEQHIEEMSLQK